MQCPTQLHRASRELPVVTRIGHVQPCYESSSLYASLLAIGSFVAQPYIRYGVRERERNT
ncbi:hypothetical protein SK128_007709, partial [Halocaridina rubra]